MAWPSDDEHWLALADGRQVVIDDTLIALSVVDCGELVAPVGRLVAADPFTSLHDDGNPVIPIPPGRYPVKVTLADVSGQADGSHLREAYATLILGEAAEVERRPLTPLADGDEAPELAEGEFVGFPVDAGAACFVDGAAFADRRSDAEEEDDDEAVAWDDEGEEWMDRMDDPTHLRAGIANIPLTDDDRGPNIILFHSGWGDGVYPVVGGYDAAGDLVRVHIDFMVVGPPRSS